METFNYYKKAIEQAKNAREVIEKTNVTYEHECTLTKNALDSGILGKNGYKEQLEKLDQERDAKIKEVLSHINEVGEEYTIKMEELGKLDGSKIDDNTMKLLNSGLILTSKDWQQLANQHKDNAIMTRLLKQKYEENRPKEKTPIVVQFGQVPEERQDIFNKFIKTLYNACESGICPSLATGKRFKTTIDYYNFIAQNSLKDMQLFGEESFNIDEDFPAETENGKINSAANKTTNIDSIKFDFNFTPIRNAEGK